ncbi:3-ketoacyl-ACP reductase [Metarhizobium album]|uniref:3-ketoacyl-ACP reductase n=1 Tax=Metarhizobium album TaxID=2182425 RepID=A0A2U2DJI5_9HYPH|nr:SDR family oxidoreductase [Rhizobium album]PWE53438.1 3-ketoacyl-ACP reductase [Rhizobium album]
MDSRIALVTGASRGIGRSVALKLAAAGYSVVVNYNRAATDAELVVSEVTKMGGKAKAIQADVSISADVVRLFDESAAAFGKIDVVVSNAGVMSAMPLAQVDDAEFERVVSANLRGTFYVSREAARRLPDGGRLVLLSSTTLALNAPGYSVYNATKGAVEGIARVAAKELGSRGITVNVVAPGPVETELFMAGKSEELVQRMAAMAPAGRLGQPEDIANIIAFLASPDSGWINGQVIRANGGIA